MEVVIIGEHECSGRHGFICGVGICVGGVNSYPVELEPENHKVVIPATNLIPRCVYICNDMDSSVTKAPRSIVPQIGSDLRLRLWDYEGQTGRVLAYDTKYVYPQDNPYGRGGLPSTLRSECFW
jgi:hypothetical protein